MFDSRQTRRLLERMGINMQEVKGAEEVIIKTGEKEIVIRDPMVYEIKAKGMRMFQVSGSDIEEKEIEKPKISEEDIALVMSQTGVSKEKAIAALEEANGDIALAIMHLQTS